MLDRLIAGLGLRDSGDELQRQYPPEWILRTLASAIKKFLIESLANDVNVPEIAKDLGLKEEDAARVCTAIFDHLRRKY